MLTSREQEILEIISGEDARKNVSELIMPMDRTAGTEAEKEGAKKVKEKLSYFVDTCSVEEVPVTAYYKTEGRLEVVSPVQLSIPCLASRLSGAGKGMVTLLDAINGTKENYSKLGKEVKGSAVLATCRSPIASVEERIMMCIEARHQEASCLIYNIPEKNEEVESAHVTNVDFPALLISSRSTEELRKLISEHGKVKVNFESILDFGKSTTMNIMGQIEGSKYPNEVIYITAHHDSWYYGANDNISSVACLLETAKIFQKHRPRRTVKFIVFGSEESGPKAEETMLFGLAGSWGYSEAHKSELQLQKNETPICIINGEMMGFSERMEAMSSPDLLPLIREAVADLGHYAIAEEPTVLWTLSDHLSFHTLGIPAVLMWPASDLGTLKRSPFFGVYHSNGDSIDIIKSSALKKNASLMALLALRADSIDVPYSMISLKTAGFRGMDCLSKAINLQALFDEKVKKSLEIKSRDDQLKHILRLIRVVNTNSYTLIGYAFSNKFSAICDAISKLRDARNILELESDIDRALGTIATIPLAVRYLDWSKSVSSYIDKKFTESEIASRLSLYLLDLRDVFSAILNKENIEVIIAKLDSKLNESVNMAETWISEYENSLNKI